jgi:pyruvate/2-oxoglutarate dehydrogenase complex dihydrolipoamide dehydrogenase (E3) component
LIVAETESYDVVVLGTGEAGKFMSWHMASSGKRTAAIERHLIGGACPNVACLPTKNIIHSAKVASYATRGTEFGVEIDHWRLNMAQVNRRRREMVDGLHEVHMQNFQKSGAEIVMGRGRFVGERTIEVTGHDGKVRVLRGERVFVNTGTRATIDPIPGLVAAQPLTHIEALELEALPEHLVILGGGYVGLEFAQAMRRFGSKVTIIERSKRVLPREDDDVAEAMAQLLTDDGIEVVAGVDVLRVEGTSGSRVTVTVTRGSEESKIEGTHLLAATGRTPNTEHMGFDAAGVALRADGFIQVNEKLETTAKDVWAMGDCTGGPRFTHISFDDFRIIRDNLNGGNRVTTGRLVPSCLFTDPELARAGMTEQEATAAGKKFKIAKVPMKAVLRTRTLSETRGFLKALIGDDKKILGFVGFGYGAGEIMAVIQLGMQAGLQYTMLREMTVAHPTLAEGVVVLLSAV